MLANQQQINEQTMDVPTLTTESGVKVTPSAKKATRGRKRKLVDPSDTPPNQFLDDEQIAPISTSVSESRQSYDLPRNELNPTSTNEDVATKIKSTPRGRKRKIADISLETDVLVNERHDMAIEGSRRPHSPTSNGRPKPRPRTAAHLREKGHDKADQAVDNTSTSSKTALCVGRGSNPEATHVMSTRSSVKRTNESNQFPQDSFA